MSELASWRCHKVVRAGKILATDGNRLCVEGRNGVEITVTVPDDFFARKRPDAGAYYIEYAGGYQSWSPADIFEAGYRRDWSNERSGL